MTDLLFTASFPPPGAGGSVEYLYNIFSHLPPRSALVHTANADRAKAGHFDESFPQRIIRSRYIIHVLEGYSATKLRKLAQYILWPVHALWLVVRERPHVIHIGEYNIAGLVALACKRLLSTPYIIYTYAEELTYLDNRPLHKKLLLAMLRNASAVITVSEYTRHLLVDRGVVPGRIHKILPAVGAGKRVPVTAEQVVRVRTKYGLNDHPVLLTVGRITERKGHASVIESLPAVLRQFSNLKYVIVGTGPREMLLKDQVKAAGLENSVVFAGGVDDNELSGLYESCDCFVMPHRQIQQTNDTEGCPTVFLEAGAHAKPVIGGNAGGVSDAILHERTGFIIDGTDVDLLARTIITVLSRPDLARQMGMAGSEYVAKLTPERNASAVSSVIDSIIRG